MKKIALLLISLTLLINNSQSQDIWKTSEGTVSFFSSALLEDIYAESKKFAGAINTKTNVVAVFVKINTMQMENKLQQQHFNEKYMESDKFPKGTFKGKVVGDIDWEKDGKYTVNVVGNLEIHGVSLERTIPVTIIIKGDNISVESKFKVKIEEHKVKVPKLVFNKIAEIVDITLNATFLPYDENK